MSDRPLKFSRRQRLRLRRDFERVFRRRVSASDGLLVLYADRNDLPYGRIGIVVSRRLGNAVTRNRIKRLVREAYRLGQHDRPTGLDLICIPRRARGVTLADLSASLSRLTEKLANRLA